MIDRDEHRKIIRDMLVYAIEDRNQRVKIATEMLERIDPFNPIVPTSLRLIRYGPKYPNQHGDVYDAVFRGLSDALHAVATRDHDGNWR